MIYENNKKYIGGAGAIDLEPFVRLSEAVLEYWKPERWDENLTKIPHISIQTQNFIY